MSGPILLCGNDPVLLRTREMLLSHAGFIVSICSENDIASMPKDHAIALAVMGHSMPAEQQVETAKLVRLKWPNAQILFLTQADTQVVKLSAMEYEAGSGNPSHLIQVCRQILEGSV
jgi:DNA-binding response OmpR family regulator